MAEDSKTNKSSAAELVPATSFGSKATSNGGKATFSKEYLANGDRFNFLDRSILNIELKDGESYTIDDAKDIVKKYKEAI